MLAGCPTGHGTAAQQLEPGSARAQLKQRLLFWIDMHEPFPNLRLALRRGRLRRGGTHLRLRLVNSMTYDLSSADARLRCEVIEAQTHTHDGDEAEQRGSCRCRNFVLNSAGSCAWNYPSAQSRRLELSAARRFKMPHSCLRLQQKEPNPATGSGALRTAAKGLQQHSSGGCAGGGLGGLGMHSLPFTVLLHRRQKKKNLALASCVVNGAWHESRILSQKQRCVPANLENSSIYHGLIGGQSPTAWHDARPAWCSSILMALYGVHAATAANPDRHQPS